jgi:transcription antitermination factor NusA-like protein
LSLEKTYPSLQDVYFHKAVEANRVLAIVVGKGDVARLLSYGGKILRELGKKVGKRIRVLENGVDDRKFLEDLFAPLSIITINRIWIPDGTTQTRVILRRTRRQSPLINVEALKKIAKELRGITIRVEFAD